jgi:hypothetical protein
MPPANPPPDQPWLESPLRTAAGELQLAGRLKNVAGIDPGAMRVLGSYALVLMVEGRGYYRDARGADLPLTPGDAVLVLPELAHAYGPLPGEEWTQVYFVFSGPQFDLWRRLGLLMPERPVLRLGTPNHWQRRLHAVLENEPRGPVGAPLRALGHFLDVLAEMIAVDGEAADWPSRDAWLEKSLRLLGNRGAGGWATPHDVARGSQNSAGSHPVSFKNAAGSTGPAPPSIKAN